jgi:TatD DNase family protein
VLVDSHCHLADAAFAGDARDAVERAVAAGVGHLVVIGESREAADKALALALADPRVSATAGVHPHVASGWDAGTAAWLTQRLADERVVAAGEMGLDYHYDYSPRDIQRTVFEAQMDIAAAAGKPAIIHSREADDDVAAVPRNHPGTVAVLHSFSSGPTVLQAGLALGHYVSFSGMITFKSWRQDAAIRQVPQERLLVETDAPYLAPVPHRGKRNEPAFVVQVAERMATVLGVTSEDVARITTANARRLFGRRIPGQNGDRT